MVAKTARKGKKKVKARVSKARKLPMARTPVMGVAAQRYAAALLHPFSKEAEGVRVPEPYAIATVTRKVHVPMVLTTNASGGLDFNVQPHLIASFWQSLGTMSGGVVKAVTNLPVGMGTRAAVSEATLGAIFTTYRIVSVGVRIKTNLDFTKSGGRIYGAVIPASAELPAIFTSGTTHTNAWNCLAVPNDGSTSISTNILALPRGFQFTVSELMSEGGAEVHFPICSARALDFLDAHTQVYEQHLVAGGSPAVGLGQFQAQGHSQFVLRGEGLQPSADVLTCEVIYHVEGVPQVGNTLVEAMPHTPAPASPHEVHLAHRIAAAAPVVSYVSQKLREAAGLSGKYGKYFNSAAKVGDAAERVLGIAARGLALL